MKFPTYSPVDVPKSSEILNRVPSPHVHESVLRRVRESRESKNRKRAFLFGFYCIYVYINFLSSCAD